MGKNGRERATGRDTQTLTVVSDPVLVHDSALTLPPNIRYPDPPYPNTALCEFPHKILPQRLIQLLRDQSAGGLTRHDRNVVKTHLDKAICMGCNNRHIARLRV